MAPRIMVVDDDPVIRRLVELRFRLATSTLLHGEPAEAVRLATSERPDAVVLDVMMPGMDGFEVCRRVRTGRTFATPGDAGTGHRFEARYLGASTGSTIRRRRAGRHRRRRRPGRARREPLLSFSFGAALSSELVTPHPKALLELAVERSRSLRLRARNTIAIGPTAERGSLSCLPRGSHHPGLLSGGGPPLPSGNAAAHRCHRGPIVAGEPRPVAAPEIGRRGSHRPRRQPGLPRPRSGPR